MSVVGILSSSLANSVLPSSAPTTNQNTTNQNFQTELQQLGQDLASGLFANRCGAPVDSSSSTSTSTSASILSTLRLTSFSVRPSPPAKAGLPAAGGALFTLSFAKGCANAPKPFAFLRRYSAHFIFLLPHAILLFRSTLECWSIARRGISSPPYS